MSDRDDAPSAEGPVAAEVGERVTAVLTAAEAAASAIRHDAEEAAITKRQAAELEAARYGEEKRREADALLESRLQRIAEVSDGLVERAERIVSQLDEAEDLKRKMQSLVTALGDAAEELANDVAQSERPALTVVPETDEAVETAEAAHEQTPAAEEAEGPPEAAPEPVRQTGEAMSPLDRLKAAGTPRPEGPERRGRFSREEEEGAPADPSTDELLGARLVALQMAVAGSQRDEVERHLRNAFQVDNPTEILDEVFGKADISS